LAVRLSPADRHAGHRLGGWADRREVGRGSGNRIKKCNDAVDPSPRRGTGRCASGQARAKETTKNGKRQALTIDEIKVIGEVIELPERVRKGEFVLNLSTGFTEPEKTLEKYFVTPQLVDFIEDALGFIQSAVEGVRGEASQSENRTDTTYGFIKSAVEAVRGEASRSENRTDTNYGPAT
jgi:hypothetical protein